MKTYTIPHSAALALLRGSAVELAPGVTVRALPEVAEVEAEREREIPVLTAAGADRLRLRPDDTIRIEVARGAPGAPAPACWTPETRTGAPLLFAHDPERASVIGHACTLEDARWLSWARADIPDPDPLPPVATVFPVPPPATFGREPSGDLARWAAWGPGDPVEDRPPLEFWSGRFETTSALVELRGGEMVVTVDAGHPAHMQIDSRELGGEQVYAIDLPVLGRVFVYAVGVRVGSRRNQRGIAVLRFREARWAYDPAESLAERFAAVPPVVLAL